jgi:hypothetical protein
MDRKESMQLLGDGEDMPQANRRFVLACEASSRRNDTINGASV